MRRGRAILAPAASALVPSDCQEDHELCVQGSACPEAVSMSTSSRRETPSRSSARRAASRVVKRRSWARRALDLPERWWSDIEDALSLLEIEPAAYPIAVALSVLQLYCRLTLARPRGDRLEQLASETPRWQWVRARSDPADLQRSVLSLLCIAVSIANAVYVARARRDYSLFSRLPNDLVASPNASAVDANFTARRQNLSQWLRSLGTAPFRTPVKSKPLQVQQLSIWSPSPFSKRILTVYSPLTALLIQSSVTSPFRAFLYALSIAQTWLLIHFYDALVRDKQLLSGEGALRRLLALTHAVMREYDRKIVNPVRRALLSAADACRRYIAYGPRNRPLERCTADQRQATTLRIYR